jgi:hypothetical protein
VTGKRAMEKIEHQAHRVEERMGGDINKRTVYGAGDLKWPF